MSIFVKRPDNVWDEVTNDATNVRVKNSTGWVPASLVHLKTPTGWVIVWDNAAPPPVITATTTAAYGASTSSITITWTQPTIYTFVKYQFTTNGGATWGEDSTSEALRSKTWNGLAEKTSFTVGVRVVNTSNRTGDATSTITTANSNPSPVTSGSVNAQTSSSGTLNWAASVSTDLRGSGLSYAINNSNDTVRVGDTDSTSFTVTGLGQNTSTTYKVYARDTGDLYSTPVSLTVSTINAAPPAATATFSTTSYQSANAGTDPSSVRRTVFWRVQYSGENIKACTLYLFNSANNYTGTFSSITLAAGGATSVDAYPGFADLLPGTEYKVMVRVRDDNDVDTDSALVSYTTPGARNTHRVSTIAWSTSGMNPSSGMSSSTAVSGFPASNVYGSGWWLSNTNTTSTGGTSFEHITWDGSWDHGSASVSANSRDHLTGTDYDFVTANPGRLISGYNYSAADTESGASGNGSTTDGDFSIYLSLTNGSASTWSNPNGQSIPYTGSNGYNIPYVDFVANIGSDGYIDRTAMTDRQSEPFKVRFTLTKLRVHTGYTGYRASCYTLGVSTIYAYVINTEYYD